MYPTNRTQDIAAALGINSSTVQRIAKRIGLCKDAEHIKLCRHHAISQAAATSRGRLKAEVVKRKIASTQLRNWQRDRIRKTIGLEQRHQLRIPFSNFTHNQRAGRYNAVHKYNYLLDCPAPLTGKERYTIYYDEQTERSAKFEAWQSEHNHLIFKPANG